jgi:hypothetical protein
MRNKHPTGPDDRFPYPPKVRWRNRVHAHFAGRRDARAGMTFDEEGHLPFTRELVATGHRGQSEVDHRLHDHVEGVDRAIATILETIADARRAITRIDEKLARISGADAPAESERGIANSREQVRLRAQRDQQQARASEGAIRLAQLLSDRRHTKERADAAADAWESRFHALAACHRRGYRRRRRNAEIPSSAVFPDLLPWRASGELPLLIPIIDPDAREILDLTLRPFHTGRHNHRSQANANPREETTT